MSRIGKKPIPLPQGVDATIAKGEVTIKGPKGLLIIPLNSVVSVSQSPEKALEVAVQNEDNKSQKALWGLTRQLLANAVAGVQKPFEKSLEFVGVGFKVAAAGADKLNIEVGFSHPVVFQLPKGIEAKVDKQIVTISGVDKHLVGETAAQIRRIKKPEPYKGKGIKYTTEVIKRKAGKAAAKSA
jgi:large subunit ribosomal protein L6